MGDLPIFVAHDSADVWARRELFRLDADGQPDRGRRRAAGLLQRDRAVVGQPALPMGCPRTRPATPGGSSASARCSTLVDRVRIDHFRGFEASWEVP